MPVKEKQKHFFYLPSATEDEKIGFCSLYCHLVPLVPFLSSSLSIRLLFPGLQFSFF
jgi:hypothetical protein